MNNQTTPFMPALLVLFCCSQACSTPTTDESDSDTGTPEQPVLYVVSMMHAEDAINFMDLEVAFNTMAGPLQELDALFSEHGAKTDFGPDWTFILGVQAWGPTLLTDHLAAGHGLHTHAHETSRSIKEVNDLLLEVGVSENRVANGGFKQEGPDGQNWVGYLAQQTDDSSQPLFTTAVAYKDADTQLSNGIGICFRPSTSGDWTVHDPEGPLWYIGSNALQSVGGGALDFDALRDWIDDRLANLDPSKVNTLYWHDSLHKYGQPAQASERIERWEQELTEYFDPLVADGKIVWKTFAEMSDVCQAHEAEF